MAKRVDAVKRLVLGVLWYLAMFVVSPVLVILSVLYFVVDVLWQLATGREGLSSDGGFVARLYEWQRENFDYIMYGAGEFKALP